MTLGIPLRRGRAFTLPQAASDSHLDAHRDVVKNVLGRGLQPVFTGTLLGLAAAAGLSWILHTTLVFRDPRISSTALPSTIRLHFSAWSASRRQIAAASAIPVRRAGTADPPAALRFE
jgi:ABC-type lipoprotein release transport system permease subunit